MNVCESAWARRAEHGRERLHAERHLGRLEDGDVPLAFPVQAGVARLEDRGATAGVHVRAHQALGGQLVDEGQHLGGQRLVQHDVLAVVGQHLAAGLAVQGVEQPPRGGRVVDLVADHRGGADLLELAQRVQQAPRRP